jgi:hypothetical protein
MTAPVFVQDIWANATCYGCGPSNPDGLQIKSYLSEDGRFLLADFQPQAKYNAGFPNVMYGGLVASLIDCHSIWTAITFSYLAEDRPLGSDPAISFVTGQLQVKYLKPTPLDQPILLKAWVEGKVGRKTRILSQLGPQGQVTAEGEVLAVRISADKSIGVV